MYHINCGKESGRNTDAATAEYPDNVLFWRPGENGRYCAIDTDFFIFIGGSTMRNKKGFTLVELVIVIAVIAILAGVMIGTFASVVKKAKESAKMQEMTAQKQEQIANDIDAKLKNAEWLGWSDFETKLAEAVSKAVGTGTWDKDQKENMVAAMKEAVDKALAEYAANLGKNNTGLTEEQVKYIVETALDKKSYSGVTAEQVKAIVNSAVSGSSTLTKSQVQAIVDKSAGLTVAEVAAAINRATAENKTNLDTAITDIKVELGKVKGEIKDATLSEDDIAAIVSKYVVDGKAKGDFTWYTKDAKDYTIDSADQLVALATVANGGDDFAGKTITIPKVKDKDNNDVPATIELKEDWVNVKSFAGIFNGNGATVTGVKFDEVYYDTKDKAVNGKSVKIASNSAGDYYGSKTAYGFIDELTTGSELKNITIEYKMEGWYEDPDNTYTYMGGAVGVARDGAKLTDVHVKGIIKAWGRCGGLVGYQEGNVTYENCSFEGTLETKHTANEKVTSTAVYLYSTAAGVVGYVDSGEIILKNVTVKATLVSCDNKGVEIKYEADKNNDVMNRTATISGLNGTIIGFDTCTINCIDGAGKSITNKGVNTTTK